VASIISEAIGRPLTHERITIAELQVRLTDGGMADEYARKLAELDGDIAQGLEAKLSDEVLKLTGYNPKSFRTFALENRKRWL
jgi:hypothetical protein